MSTEPLPMPECPEDGCYETMIVCGDCKATICPDCDCDVAGSCPGNVFCNRCGREVDSDDGTPHVCSDNPGCNRTCESLGLKVAEVAANQRK